jgi:hypothetical protein
MAESDAGHNLVEMDPVIWTVLLGGTVDGETPIDPFCAANADPPASTSPTIIAAANNRLMTASLSGARFRATDR